MSYEEVLYAIGIPVVRTLQYNSVILLYTLRSNACRYRNMKRTNALYCTKDSINRARMVKFQINLLIKCYDILIQKLIYTSCTKRIAS